MTTYKVFDVDKKSGAAPVEVASSSSLSSVLRSAKLYVDNKWANVPKIFVQNNGNRKYSATAMYLKAYKRKVLVHNFNRQIEVVYSPD